MKFTIQRFIFLLFIIVFSLGFAIITYYHTQQENKTSEVILKSIKSNMSEVSYILSKSIKNKNDAVSSRPLLDRISSNNEFIAAIIMHNEQDVILTTDPHYTKILAVENLCSDDLSAYDNLINAKACEGDIRFYIGNKIQTLKLLFIFDKDEISLYFHKKKSDFFIYFGVLPVLSLLIILFLLRYFVAKPLERLRQFAYYQNDIPSAFKLQELEIIRYSMVQTFQRLENEKKELYSMARTDSLSGLANRNALNEYLERLIANSSRDNKEFAFLFLDLDHFKVVNDSLGHNVGDELLKTVASIIDEVLRSNDFVARVGGDEFVIIVQDYKTIMELTNIIDRIQSQLAQTWIIQTNPINIHSSIGIAFYPKDGEEMLSLMKHSDIAMYEAKQNGRAQYHFFTEELNTRVQDTIKLDKEMREALINREYALYYQPKVDVQNGDIIGAEALIRWISPSKGMIPPDVFIPLAEENGFIMDLGAWVVEEAVRQQKAFADKGLDIVISINVSSKQLLNENFGKYFISLLEKNMVHADKIDMEITEYMFLQQNENNFKILHEINDYGITISLDDFGTGYSSLSYLKEFPIDYLKIDKAFLDDYDTQSGSIFIDTIVKMGQTLNMKIIAEGVEEKGQVEYLKSIGCDYYQGYYFSKPLSVSDFESKYIS